VIFAVVLFTTRIRLPQARQLPMMGLYGLLAFGEGPRLGCLVLARRGFVGRFLLGGR
jgi:hypothetical protein